MQRIISAWLRLGIQVTALVPGYERNRYQWRRRILANIIRAAKKAGVKYDDNHTFEVVVLLYLKKGKPSGFPFSLVYLVFCNSIFIHTLCDVPQIKLFSHQFSAPP